MSSISAVESPFPSRTDTYTTKYGAVTLYKNEVYIAEDFKRGGYWDESTLMHLKTFVSPSRNVLEIGGHCGTSSIVYASFLNSGKKVFVYEPQKSMYDLLVHNVKQNCLEEKIEAHHAGVFCFDGSGTMNAKDLDGGGGDVLKRHTEESSLPCNFGGIGIGELGEEIKLVTVDGMGIDDIGFIHCDAQGAENFIFSKSLETVRKNRPVILYEDNEAHGRYLYNTVCSAYPQYKDESLFNIKRFCMDELHYTHVIEWFCGGIDTLLLPLPLRHNFHSF